MKMKFYSLKNFVSVFALFGAGSMFHAQITPDKYSIPSISEYYMSFADPRVLMPNTTPFSVNMAINGDPKTQLGFSWFTNDVTANEGGVVQIVAKVNATESDFAGALELPATEKKLTLNYMNSSNNIRPYDYLAYAANKYDKITLGNTRNYISHKVLATNLTPNTEYSFRVGTSKGWSEIGKFKTAPVENVFSFNYTTDTQANEMYMFDISQQTVTQAMEMFPNALFNLNTGDFIETSSTSTTSATSSSEWEWERWFATMQKHWMKMPIVPVLGNHDVSNVDKNFEQHFNTDTSYNVSNANFKTKIDGTNYSFVYGNTLFMVLNYEEYNTNGYLENLGKWIDEQVAAHPEAKWKVLASHRNVYTGASHHADSDLVKIREAIAPFIDKNDIDVYFQGHDHVYEVIGPVFDKKLVPNSVTEVEEVAGGTNSNMTGKVGGTYNVYKGTLYMVNNSAGKKKYQPKTKAQMTAAESTTKVPNYFDLFTGRLGQTNEPTFSNVIVTDESIRVTTYAVTDDGEPYFFDEIKIVKKQGSTLGTNATDKKSDIKMYPVPASDMITIEAEDIKQADFYDMAGKMVLTSSHNKIDVRKLDRGVYLVRVMLKNGTTSTQKIIIK